MASGRSGLVLSLVALAAAGAGAERAREGAGSGRLLELGGSSKEPITVTADRLEYDYKSNVIVYRGDVEAVQGRARLRSDQLTVTFDSARSGGSGAPAVEAGPGTASGRLQEIVAVGNVRIDQGTRWATGGRAVFDQGERTVVLSESPVLHDGPNEVAGDRVVVYLDEDRSVVEGGRKRVKAVIHPDEQRRQEDGRVTSDEAEGDRAPGEVGRP